MVFFGAADHGLRRPLLALGVGALAFAVVTCRTPPPLPESPSDADEPPPERATSERATLTPASSAERAPETPAGAVGEKDFSSEQGELVARYEKRRALSTFRGEASYYGRAF